MKVKITDKGNVKVTLSKEEARNIQTVLNYSNQIDTYMSADVGRDAEDASQELWETLFAKGIAPRYE